LNLYLFLKDINHKRKIMWLIEKYNIWLAKVKEFWIFFYKKSQINFKYIWYRNINWKSILEDKIIDCSKIWERSGFVKYEYEKLLKQL
jgi:hypothetical protein